MNKNPNKPINVLILKINTILNLLTEQNYCKSRIKLDII